MCVRTWNEYISSHHEQSNSYCLCKLTQIEYTRAALTVMRRLPFGGTLRRQLICVLRIHYGLPRSVCLRSCQLESERERQRAIASLILLPVSLFTILIQIKLVMGVTGVTIEQVAEALKALGACA